MKIEDYIKFEYGCQDAQELLILYLTCSEELTFDERDGLELHLAHCDSCREDYEGMKLVGEALVANQDSLGSKGAFGSHTPRVQFTPEKTHDEIMDERFQDWLERTLIRRKRRERKEKIVKIKRLAKPVSAIAACLLVGFVGFFAASQLDKVSNSSSPVTSGQRHDSVRIEVISGETTEIVPAGQLITASDELKILRVNGNRQMVLNVGTKLSIEPYNLGCVVKLDEGEVYTEVEHDGKPFMVETSHGRAVITGTTFNIKADHDTMDLAVLKGSVRFESEKGSVDVAEGYQSTIAALMHPTKPIACDILQISEWAKPHDINSSLVAIPLNTNISDLSELSLAHVPFCDLTDIDYDVWIDQHREWFEREFPWTKRLQKLLAQDGVEVDTIDLLIESGDLWRFNWPEYSQQRFLTEDRQVIQGMANLYGVEASKLLFAESFSNCEADSNIEAFERWLGAFNSEGTSLAIDSIHAAMFLINTRSLAWYAADNGYIQVEGIPQVLELLQEQANIASDMLEVLNKMLLADKGESFCSGAQHEEWVKKLEVNISLVIEIEMKLVGYEISGK